jgi:hypothetical protein
MDTNPQENHHSTHNANNLGNGLSGDIDFPNAIGRARNPDELHG